MAGGSTRYTALAGLLVEGLLETEGLALTLSATDLCAVPLSVKVAGCDYG